MTALCELACPRCLNARWEACLTNAGDLRCRSCDFTLTPELRADLEKGPAKLRNIGGKLPEPALPANPMRWHASFQDGVRWDLFVFKEHAEIHRGTAVHRLSLDGVAALAELLMVAARSQR